jgi:hypothetical protein
MQCFVWIRKLKGNYKERDWTDCVSQYSTFVEGLAIRPTPWLWYRILLWNFLVQKASNFQTLTNVFSLSQFSGHKARNIRCRFTAVSFTRSRCTPYTPVRNNSHPCIKTIWAGKKINSKHSSAFNVRTNHITRHVQTINAYTELGQPTKYPLCATVWFILCWLGDALRRSYNNSTGWNYRTGEW